MGQGRRMGPRTGSALGRCRVLALLCFVQLLSGAACARLLLQDVHTLSTAGRNPLSRKTNGFAQAHEAEARSNVVSSGVLYNGATETVTAGDLYPAPRGTAATHNAEGRGKIRVASGVPGASMNYFGVVAAATTDTGNARAISASEGMPNSSQGIVPGPAARGADTELWTVGQLRTGIGAKKQAYTDSAAPNLLPPLSSGVSGVGGGPLAVAAAGQAVAFSNADAPKNGGME